MGNLYVPACGGSLRRRRSLDIALPAWKRVDRLRTVVGRAKGWIWQVWSLHAHGSTGALRELRASEGGAAQ